MRFARYFKTAFLNHWNLLGFLGGLGLGVATGFAGVICPLVVAAELIYLAGLISQPKFRDAVDAWHARDRRLLGDSEQSSRAAVSDLTRRILETLPPELARRFEAVKRRCQALSRLGEGLANPVAPLGEPARPLFLADSRDEGLDRLLWMHLRMLANLNVLDQFLGATPESDIRDDIGRLEQRLAALASSSSGGGENEEAHARRLRETFEDDLATARARLANRDKAAANRELLEAELDRLETKIASLSELAVQRQDPTVLATQIDQAAAGLLATEQTMNELRLVGVPDLGLDQPPAILRERLTQSG